MGALVVLLIVYFSRDELSEWLSNAIAEGIKRSKAS